MKERHQVHNLIILDESGSMAPIKQTTIQGFNEIVQTVKGIELEHPDQEHFISLVTFNGIGQSLVHFIDPVSKLEQIDDSSYYPDASTPLYDAIGYGVNKLRQVVEKLTNYNVLVTILTDGEENSSIEFSGIAIKNLIEELKLKRWTFTYIGTDHDIEKMAQSMSIDNTMRFEKDDEHMRAMFEKEKHARSEYSRKIRMNEETSSNFYDDENIQSQDASESQTTQGQPTQSQETQKQATQNQPTQSQTAQSQYTTDTTAPEDKGSWWKRMFGKE